MATQAFVEYLRTSTPHQSSDLQRRAVIDAGVPGDSIFEEVISGASVATSRPGLVAAIQRCRPGSTLVLWRLDRLGRSLVDVVNTVDQLAAREIGVQSISDGISPSTTHGRLMLGLFATLAEYERGLIQERVQAGMRAAAERGVRLGRPAPDPLEVATKVRMARRAMSDDGLTAGQAARMVGWSRSSLCRHMQVVPVEARLD